MDKERFEKAFEYVMKNEGNYSNDSSDFGGETKYGISKRSYPNLNIKGLTQENAKEIYRRDFWMRGRYDEIKAEKLAIKLFDLAVNVGTIQANKLIQRALRAVGKTVAEDGMFGAITLAAVNQADAKQLLTALKSEAAGYYRLIADKNPQQQKFLSGWLNRAYRQIN